jgi:hypothetical protein
MSFTLYLLPWFCHSLSAVLPSVILLVVILPNGIAPVSYLLDINFKELLDDSGSVVQPLPLPGANAMIFFLSLQAIRNIMLECLSLMRLFSQV